MVLLRSWFSFCEWFWTPSFWIPLGLDWKDVRSNENAKFANFGDLIYPIPMAFVVLGIRYFAEKYILYPLGVKFGLKPKRLHSLQPNAILEKVYKRSKSIGPRELEELAKKTDMSSRNVERWMRRRFARTKLTVLAKFAESGWRLICYATYLSLGIYVLWGKPWLLNMDNCWIGFPHELTSDIWWFYMAESSFYWSLMITQFVDHKRKDFWQMFLHHLITLFLLAFSWTCNFTRIGVIVAVLHDTADPLLEFVKLCMYIKADTIANLGFVIFMVVWIATRLVLFPSCVLHSTLLRGHVLLSMIPAYYFFNVLLILIFCLNVFWTYFILKMALNAIRVGDVKKDARSSSDESNDDSKEQSPEAHQKD